MKFAILFALVAVISLAWGWDEEQNGQPGCKTDTEMTAKYYRNHYDPTRYFECVEKGKPGVERKCDTQHLYQPSKKECVKYDDWEWEEHVDPPSFPDSTY